MKMKAWPTTTYIAFNPAIGGTAKIEVPHKRDAAVSIVGSVSSIPAAHIAGILKTARALHEAEGIAATSPDGWGIHPAPAYWCGAPGLAAA